MASQDKFTPSVPLGSSEKFPPTVLLTTTGLIFSLFQGFSFVLPQMSLFKFVTFCVCVCVLAKKLLPIQGQVLIHYVFVFIGIKIFLISVMVSSLWHILNGVL